jgi:hypothetical protein
VGLGPPVRVLGVGLTIPHRKNKFVTKMLNKPRTWTDPVDKRPRRKKIDMNKLFMSFMMWIWFVQK